MRADVEVRGIGALEEDEECLRRLTSIRYAYILGFVVIDNLFRSNYMSFLTSYALVILSLSLIGCAAVKAHEIGAQELCGTDTDCYEQCLKQGYEDCE